MGTHSNGDSVRNESTDWCCAEHVARLARIVEQAVYKVLDIDVDNPETKEETSRILTQAIHKARIVLKTDCEALREGIEGGEGLYGSPAEDAKEVMAMLPNDSHPSAGCSCRSCLQKWPIVNGLDKDIEALRVAIRDLSATARRTRGA